MPSQAPLCIIMARGGSKRVPRKNVRPFCGKPMIAWSVEAAVESQLFSSIVVSTEDEEITRVAKNHGAEIPFMRPNELADDFSTTADVLKYTLERIQSEQGSLPEYCCCLYGTSVFVKPAYLQEAQERAISTGAEMIMAVAEYGHPIERALQFSEDGSLFYRQPEFVSTRTQDIKPSYHDLGLFYWFSTKAFLKSGGKRFLPLSKNAIVVPRSAAVDIDNEEDWQLAEKLAQVQGLA